MALFASSCSKEEAAVADEWLNDSEALYELNSDKITIEEGIAGTLTLIEGNCMPMVPASTTCKEYPVKRTIRIYSYTTLQEAKTQEPTYFNPQGSPILSVEADEEGFYQAKLAPGKYSVFIVEEGKLYANGFDGQGGINPVQVQQSQVSRMNLILNYAAY
ncbi:hypothetical protein GCM10007389_28030 [Pontibacter akesuensis]|nr:hypothetical protein GCM10007389_28030 [Pontibacter akesuensis]